MAHGPWPVAHGAERVKLLGCKVSMDSASRLVAVGRRTPPDLHNRTVAGDSAQELNVRMSKKQRAALISELSALPVGAPRVLLATGKLVGEDFDRPLLDTLVLAMPVSWKGTLQQYAGRLHR